MDPGLARPATILEAQQALMRRRAAEGIESTTPAQAEASARWHAAEQTRRSQSIEDVLADAVRPIGIEMQKRADGPAKRPQFPVDPIGEDATDRRPLDPEELHLARLEAGVPDAFMVCPAGCPWSNGLLHCKHCGKRLVHLTWRLLGGLIGKSGFLPAVTGVETVDGELRTGAEAVAEIQQRMSAYEHVVLVGDSRTGKSVSAAAFVDAELRAGAERLRWMSPFGLRDNAIDRAIGAKTLVLDDIGEEMSNASMDTGLSAQRTEPIVEVIAAIARTRGKRLIITTYLDRDRMELYGGGVAARVYEGAHQIQFRSQS